MGEIHEKPDLSDFCYCYWLKYQGLQDNALMFCVFFFLLSLDQTKKYTLVVGGGNIQRSLGSFESKSEAEGSGVCCLKVKKSDASTGRERGPFLSSRLNKFGVKLMKPLVK